MNSGVFETIQVPGSQGKALDFSLGWQACVGGKCMRGIQPNSPQIRF